jgi:hypothetical protein
MQQPVMVQQAPVMVQGGFQGSFAPPRYSSSSRYGQGYDDDEESDPLKKAILLSGVTSGKINAAAAVALDRNSGMSATDTAIVSSMGNGMATVAALGGLDSRGSSGGLFGSSRGGSSSSNLLQTMVMANALSPSSSNDNGFGNLATFALFSNMGDDDDQHGYHGPF